MATEVLDFRVQQQTGNTGETPSFGIDVQDCALIASTFERGANWTPSEAAVFAPIQRSLDNATAFSNAAIAAMSSYLRPPQEAAENALKQAQSLASDVNPQTNTGGGSSTRTDHGLQGLGIQNTITSMLNSQSAGDAMLKLLKDCIPCEQRLQAFIEMHPNIDLLGVLENDIQNRLNMLASIGEILLDFNIYGDFCALMSILSFMCIPDLQRMIVLLMSLISLEAPNLDFAVGFLQVLIAPLFTPILMSLASLMDQFGLLITNPLKCVIDALDQQLQKLNFEHVSNQTQRLQSELAGSAQPLPPNLTQPIADLQSSLKTLRDAIEEGREVIHTKIAFYVDELSTLLGDLSKSDEARLRMSVRKLRFSRLANFISTLIQAMIKGQVNCGNTGKPPEIQEIDNFFNNFLNPNSAFNLWIDPQGQFHIDEKTPGLLPNSGNVFQFEGTDLVTLSPAAQKVANTLTQKVQIVVPCKLETSAADAQKVNQWIKELNQS